MLTRSFTLPMAAAFVTILSQAVAAPVPTNLAGANTFPAPPAGFDAVHAGDDALSEFGFPARPDPFRARAAYTAWARLISGAKTRVMPVLKILPSRHRPMMAAASPRGGPRAGGVTGDSAGHQFNTGYSSNWSGEVLNDSATSYGYGSFFAIWGQFNVPVAVQQYGVCTNGTEYSATWVGMDGGFGISPDVVQAGTESDATCFSGFTTPDYYAWYEWYPSYSVAISNFSVSPGQDIDVEVAANSSTSASMFMTNETTNQYVSITFYAPRGTAFVGNTAEWIVERPEVSSALATLTNYGIQYMTSTVSLVSGRSSPVWGGAGAFEIPLTLVTMLQNNAAISVPFPLGFDGLVVTATGAAQ